MAAMHSAANLSRMNVDGVRRIATGLGIHHRENGIRLKKHNLIQKILVKQIAGETDYASASKVTLLPTQESHLERKDQALPVGKAGKKVTVSLQSLFAFQQKRRSEETQGYSTNEKVTPQEDSRATREERQQSNALTEASRQHPVSLLSKRKAKKLKRFKVRTKYQKESSSKARAANVQEDGGKSEMEAQEEDGHRVLEKVVQV
jgi:hypothetical protein